MGGAEVENATGFKTPLGFSKGQKVAPPKEPRGEQNAACETVDQALLPGCTVESVQRLIEKETEKGDLGFHAGSELSG